MADDNAKPTAKGGDTTDNDHHGGSDGHASDIPEESVSSDSDLALSKKVDERRLEQEG